MKTELEHQDIQLIAERVVDLLKPLLLSISKGAESDTVMTKKQLAQYLQISESSVNALLADNSLPYFKISNGQSGGVRFRKSEIDKWITRQSIPAVNPVKERMIKPLMFAKA